MQRRYKPVYGMDRGARLWIVRTAQKHLWRVPSWYTLDDLVQDGFVQYSRILEKYPHITETRHRMGLFKTTFLHYIDDLSKQKTRLPECNESSLIRDGESGSPFESIADLPATDLLAKAPEVVHRLLSVINTEDGRRSLRALYRIRKDGTRETTNTRLARLTGLTPETDFEGVFRSYFSDSDGPPPRPSPTKQTRKRPVAWVADHLKRLGCTPEQVSRHLARATA